MYSLIPNEEVPLRSQTVTLEKGECKYRKLLPYLFTKQGVSMLSSVLNSPIAIQISTPIKQVFVNMRQWAANYKGLLQKMQELPMYPGEHNEHIRNVCQIHEELVRPAVAERKPIGFKRD